MPGNYKSDESTETRAATLATELGGEPWDPAIGAPLLCAASAAFDDVPMGNAVGGPIADGPAGVRTGDRSDCVIVAIMQRDADGDWSNYFFTHLMGGVWSPEINAVYAKSIPDPGRAWVAMVSNSEAGLGSLLEEINEENKGKDPIPADQVLTYVAKNDPTFAMNLEGAWIGRVG